MPHTHEYDCKICGAHLDSKQELDDHRKENHSSQQAGESGSKSSSSSSNRSQGMS